MPTQNGQDPYGAHADIFFQRAMLLLDMSIIKGEGKRPFLF